MGDLSPHFSKIELEDPTTHECKMDPHLLVGLERLRNLANVPVYPTSGYRSPAHNAEVGGVGHSEHMEGKACDLKIKVNGRWLTTFELFVLAEEIDEFRNGGIGIYPGEDFIHVDVRGTRARWSRVNGIYVATNEFLTTIKGATPISG